MIEDTIFSPSFGNRPSRLVGRDQFLARLVKGLKSKPGSRERATVILGQRGNGKTVLLWELKDRATEMGYIVASPTISSEGMLDRIVEKIQDAGEQATRQSDKHLTGASLGALGFSAGLQFTKETQSEKSPQFKLTQLTRKLNENGKGILILIDELQANSPEVRQLVILYQEMVGEGLDVALVMAGLPGAVSATLNDKVLTFLNRAEKAELEPLQFADVDSFYKKSFEDLGIDISEDLRIKAAAAANGSPYMLQLIGHNIVLYASKNSKVEESDIDNALAAAKITFENDICKTTLAALSDKDTEFLRAMAQVGSPSRISDITSIMAETSDYVQKYRKRLIDAGIITAYARGKVDFAVPFLEDYLSKEA